MVISTLSLKMSINNGDIEAKAGDNVYKFNAKFQSYVPYTSCLCGAACIYVYGLLCLRRHGVSPGSSSLQFAATTSMGNTLRTIATDCSRGGEENVSESLKNLKLRFGLLLSDSNPIPVYGFETKDELKKLG